MIERDIKLSVRRQCELVGLSRACFYKALKDGEKRQDVPLMKEIDRIYTDWPFYGSRRVTAELNRRGRNINRKRIQRLMRLMGIYGQTPGIMTSHAHPEHRKYPYLLGGMQIDSPNKVWCTDITYIPMKQGFAYLVAVMDWHSRMILSWELSNTLDSDFCVRALRNAIAEYGRPEVFNSDQGCQFTSEEFTGVLKSEGIRISMDGKGRCSDNILIERFWWSLKYEDIYLKDYADMPRLHEGLDSYFGFYNANRVHESLEYMTPLEIYRGVKAA
jgi:putative transposase